MKKVAVFGKPGGGKSTFSRKLSATTGLPLYPLDSIEFTVSGERVDEQVFTARHDEILAEERWIIDGMGTQDAFRKRLAEADTLIYIDLSYRVSYWWVTKRLFKGLFVTPEGWPKGCSVLKGTIQSYRVLWRCPAFWNDGFKARLERIADGKRLHVVTSLSAMRALADSL